MGTFKEVSETYYETPPNFDEPESCPTDSTDFMMNNTEEDEKRSRRGRSNSGACSQKQQGDVNVDGGVDGVDEDGKKVKQQLHCCRGKQKLEVVSLGSEQPGSSGGRHMVLWVAKGCLSRLLLRHDWSEVKQICRMPLSQQIGIVLFLFIKEREKKKRYGIYGMYIFHVCVCTVHLLLKHISLFKGS